MGGHSLARIVRAHSSMHSFLLRLGIEVVSLARIQRGPSEAARWASTETTSMPNSFPSLPPGHFIAFLLQTPIDVIRVGLVGLARRADNSVKESRQETPDRSTRRPYHRPQAG